MSEITGIQWTDKTWNPWRGCTKIHARCWLCYMFTEQKRYGKDPSVVTRTKTWGDPLKWQREAAAANRIDMVFTCSWSDWFHADADEWRDEAWAVIKACPNLTFQILTKRPDRIANHLPNDWGNGYQNVWLGSSLDPQDKNGMELFRNHAKVKFLSLEPLLAPVDLSPALGDLDWVIVGGESGHGARPCDTRWIRSIVNQCAAAEVPCFVKQLGSVCVDAGKLDDEYQSRFWPMVEYEQTCLGTHYLLKHKKGGNIEEFPTDLKVRQFPKLAAKSKEGK